MPHVWTIFKAFGQPAQVNQPSLINVLLHKPLFTAKEAAVGFAIGAVIGFVLGRRPRPLAPAPARLPALHRRQPDGADPRDRADGRRLGQPEAARAAAGLGRGRRDRDLPHVLPRDDQHAARASGRRPSRARADADVRGEPLERCSGSCASRRSLPYLFSALRLSATASVVGAIIGELPIRSPERPRRRDLQLQRVLLDRAAGAVGDERRSPRFSGSLSSCWSSWPRGRRAPRAGERRMSGVVEIRG